MSVAPVRILFAGMRHDYGDPARGFSFEHENFLGSLRGMAGEVEVTEVPTDVLRRERGRDGLNAELVDLAKHERPAALFAVLFEDEIDPAALRELDRLGVATIAWFSDDHWRFATHTRRHAPHWRWCVTTDSRAPAKYRALGIANVIRSQWACNPYAYHRVEGESAGDVTFVGQPHGARRAIVAALGAAGVPVACWGQGWPAGRLAQEDMIRVFARSRVNLNLTNASGGLDWRSLARCVVSRGADRRLRLRTPGAMLDAARELAGKRREQIKGRHFEIPGCGGFQLSGPADDLERYFTPGREIAIARDVREMGDMARHYLAHEDERARIADAGHARTVAEHTYPHRFREIFRAAGVLPA